MDRTPAGCPEEEEVAQVDDDHDCYSLHPRAGSKITAYRCEGAGPTLHGRQAYPVTRVKNNPATHPEGGEGNSLKVTKIY